MNGPTSSSLMKKKRANYQNVSTERKTINTKNLICCFFSRKKKLYIKKGDQGNDELTSLFDAYEQNR